MIEYEVRNGCGAVGSCSSTWQVIRLRTFRLPILLGFLSGSVSALLTYYMNYGEDADLVKATLTGALSDSAFSTSSSILGIFLVFRTGQAYARYNEGTQLIYQIHGSWFDALSSVFAFCHGSKGPKEDVELFRHTVVRLVSMCNAMMLADLEGMSTDMASTDWVYSLIDANGLDRVSHKLIENSSNKPEVVFQMLQIVLINAVTTNIVSVPPPIFQRVFADLSAAVLKFHEALKLREVPFPYPYVAIMEVLLVSQTLMTPLMMGLKVESTVMSFMLTMLVIFTMWSMSAIAIAMDDPFGANENDLGGEHLQRAFNVRLMSVFSVSPEHVATSSHKSDEHNLMQSVSNVGHVHDCGGALSHYGGALSARLTKRDPEAEDPVPLEESKKEPGASDTSRKDKLDEDMEMSACDERGDLNQASARTPSAVEARMAELTTRLQRQSAGRQHYFGSQASDEILRGSKQAGRTPLSPRTAQLKYERGLLEQAVAEGVERGIGNTIGDLSWLRQRGINPVPSSLV